MRSDMPKYPDPEQYAAEMQRVRDQVAVLHIALSDIRLAVKMQDLEVEAHKRERDEVMAALSKAYDMELRMDPKVGLMGYCVGCGGWFGWKEHFERP